MNKQELVKAIATEAQTTQVEVNKFFTAFEKITQEALKRGEKVQVTGFFNVKPVPRAARKGFDPIKQVALDIAPTVGVSIRAGEKLKKAVEDLEYKDFVKE